MFLYFPSNSFFQTQRKRQERGSQSKGGADKDGERLREEKIKTLTASVTPRQTLKERGRHKTGTLRQPN